MRLLQFLISSKCFFWRTDLQALDSTHGKTYTKAKIHTTICGWCFPSLISKAKAIEIKTCKKWRLAYSQGTFCCISRTNVNSWLAKCFDIGEPRIPQSKPWWQTLTWTNCNKVKGTLTVFVHTATHGLEIYSKLCKLLPDLQHRVGWVGRDLKDHLPVSTQQSLGTNIRSK